MVIPDNMIGKEFIGVDPGLAHLGLAVVKTTAGGMELIHCKRTNTYTNKTLGHRLQIIIDAVSELVNENTAGMGCESPSFGSQSAPYSLGAVHGLVHLVSHENQLPIIKVAPLQLHKFVTGHVRGRGRTKKEKAAHMKNQVRLDMEKIFGYDYTAVKHSDPVDASAIATITAAYLCEINFRTRHQAEVLAAIKPYDNFS